MINHVEKMTIFMIEQITFMVLIDMHGLKKGE